MNLINLYILMKKVFLFTFFCLCSVVIFAQHIDKKNQFEINLAVSGSVREKSIVGINPMFIYDRIIDDCGVGFGTGYLFSNTEQDGGGDDLYRSIPIFIDMRWMPKLGKFVSFVGVFDAGGLVNLGKDENMGHYISPQAGFRFNVAKGWSVNIRALYANFHTIESINTFGAGV